MSSTVLTFFISRSVKFFFLLFIFFFAETFQLRAQDTAVLNPLQPNYYVDFDQRRIDLLDGTADHKINLGDSSANEYADRVYFVLVDSIQRFIDSKQFDATQKKLFREALYTQLKRVTLRTVSSVKRYDNVLHFMLGELKSIQQHKLYDYLVTNISQAFNTIDVFKNEMSADSFFVFAAYYHPDWVLANYYKYANQPYSLHVLEACSKIAPVTVKRYFNPNDPIYDALKGSNDTVIKILLRIKDIYTRKSNAFTLIDAIANGKISMEQADSIGNNSEAYLREMLHLRALKNPYGIHSLDDDLTIYSLKYVRVLNDLHNEKDDIRFASVKNFTAEEMYTLIVYSEEEIFTSTFNGLFSRMMIKLGAVSGFEFLNQLGDNRFRTFIKMAAGFGKLKPFLQSMTSLYQQMLMIKFVSGLEQYNDLSQAVEVADAFASINDSLILKILRGTIRYEYVRFSTLQNFKGTTIYGLLSNLFVERNVSSANWFASVSEQYSIPNIGRVPNAKLFDKNKVCRWLIYFYDDEDGTASFASFIKTFTDKNWIIADSGAYVLIKSKVGKQVYIYANKPKHEYDGQEKLEAIFSNNDYVPEILVHRGHSYYAYKTIEKLNEETQVFILGSCGGYHSISMILERAPDIGIVSSKQIGTMFVNNPMLKLMAESIRQGKDLNWQKIWNELDVSLKNNPKAYERFLDYIPPHKNLGAIFIKAYSKMMEQE